MAELRIEPLTRDSELQGQGWTKVTVRAGELEDLCCRNRWCEANVGRRGDAWNAHHLKNYYFADRHYALMFKLAFGGRT